MTNRFFQQNSFFLIQWESDEEEPNMRNITVYFIGYWLSTKNILFIFFDENVILKNITAR